MAIAECGNGHVYNTEQYSSCPYCGNMNPNPQIYTFNDRSNGGSTMAETTGASQMEDSLTLDSLSDALTATQVDAPQPSIPILSENPFAKTEVGSDEKTQYVMPGELDFDPVVGWLVCIDGPEKGKDFRLKAKNNLIGRSEKYDVYLKRDMCIHRDSPNASLNYDIRNNVFYLNPSISANNIYLDDQPVYTAVRIDPYAVFEIGKCKMLFVPLCGPQFQWVKEGGNGGLA